MKPENKETYSEFEIIDFMNRYELVQDLYCEMRLSKTLNSQKMRAKKLQVLIKEFYDMVPTHISENFNFKTEKMERQCKGILQSNIHPVVRNLLNILE